ncbi:NfeD family protein [Paenibacillus qinlingensis]|uniref:Membrane-bound serine protease (ClpP class) n=1 Tax=Paenibacillus qinlingensis TaxID=1837343 RepID=A0ABU1NV47_9BACL|nr:NfeD family protein [Paenibacillus qinlingensis]MDR6551315.1 membrane-bound serine protease (ClpP class) [Paenibacillus qinlingensis]
MFLDNLSEFLTHPVTATVLLVVGIIGIALELLFFSSGLLALAGVAGFGLYFLGFYLAGFASFGDLTVLAIGLVLLILELVVPSFGILSVLGAICLFGGVMMASSDPKEAAYMLVIALLIAIVVVIAAIRRFKNRGIWNRFILKEQLTTSKGFTSNPDQSYLIGMTGEAVTPLRPAGTALIQGERVDVVTNGNFISANRAIVVVEVEGVRVVVKEVDNQHNN